MATALRWVWTRGEGDAPTLAGKFSSVRSATAPANRRDRMSSMMACSETARYRMSLPRLRVVGVIAPARTVSCISLRELDRVAFCSGVSCARYGFKTNVNCYGDPTGILSFISEVERSFVFFTDNLYID